MRHKGRFVHVAKCAASGLVRFPQRLRQRCANEKAAKIFVEEIDLFQAEDKRPEAGGHARGPANQLTARSHAAPQQRYVRGEFRRRKPGTQSVEKSRQAVIHLSGRH